MGRYLAASWAIGIAVNLAGSVVAQQPQSAEILQKPPIADVSQEAILSDIKALRLRLGGGVSSEFLDLKSGDGESWQQEAELEFNRELRRLAHAETQGNREKSPRRVNEPRRINEPRRVDEPRGRRDRMSDAGRQMENRPRLQGQLRRAARTMEELAAGFEEVGLYREADEMREQSRRFWKKAREMGRAER